MAQLAFEGVTKVFADGTEAVRDLDLDVGDGVECLAVCFAPGLAPPGG